MCAAGKSVCVVLFLVSISGASDCIRRRGINCGGLRSVSGVSCFMKVLGVVFGIAFWYFGGGGLTLRFWAIYVLFYAILLYSTMYGSHCIWFRQHARPFTCSQLVGVLIFDFRICIACLRILSHYVVRIVRYRVFVLLVAFVG